ncbi:hypothetical protein KY333_03885 [Candidatus Woesearchaeota archaeon]|nr:hypothetical protein [Candidatus Woesearchaeota archaeon]MBW2994623.1 hypothetical protein [Candidatus Woesearchaeota archaeon]
MSLRKAVKKHKGIRKKKERLPKWKRLWNNFNEKYLHWLEHFVDAVIPWLVLILVVVLFGEYAHDLNFFNWHWMDAITEFFHHHEYAVILFDQILVGFFCVDLYFNFFKKATFESFVKTSILDIIAVAPLGALFRVAEVGEAQLFIHAGGEVPKAAKITKAEELAKLARLEKTSVLGRATARLGKTLARIPRLFRLHRLSDFWKKK